MKEITTFEEFTNLIADSSIEYYTLDYFFSPNGTFKLFNRIDFYFQNIHELLTINSYTGNETKIEFERMIEKISITGFSKDKPIILLNGNLIDGRHRLIGLLGAILKEYFGTYDKEFVSSVMSYDKLKEVKIPVINVECDIINDPKDLIIKKWLIEQDDKKEISSVGKFYKAYNLHKDGFLIKDACKFVKCHERNVGAVKAIIESFDRKDIIETLLVKNAKVELDEYCINKISMTPVFVKRHKTSDVILIQRILNRNYLVDHDKEKALCKDSEMIESCENRVNKIKMDYKRLEMKLNKIMQYLEKNEVNVDSIVGETLAENPYGKVPKSKENKG